MNEEPGPSDMTMNSSQGLNHHDVDDDREVIKNEVEQEGYEWPTPDHTPKSMRLNSILLQTANTNPTTSSIPTPLPSSQRKRKKSNKIKDMLSEINKKKKPPVSSNSTPVISKLSGKLLRCKQEKTPIFGLTSPGQVKSTAVVRAREVEQNLGPDAVSFVKPLVRSHVVTGFWMSLPVPFCKFYLPRKDTMVILEDESGEQFETKYIVEKYGLSAGWKRFAVSHQLLEGDVLVFHLLGQDKFKVYIVRANDLTDVDGALSLLNLDTNSKQNNADKVIKPKKRRRPTSIPLSHSIEQSGNDSEPGLEILDGSKFTGPVDAFTTIKNFADFHIMVNNLCIDAELPENMRVKYYELCKSQNTYLHNKILSGLYSKLVAGIIGETVNIADSIRSCKLTTSRDEIGLWEKSLESFSLLGMNVGFLRDRIQRLLSLLFESEGGLETKRYIEAKIERSRVEDEITSLEAKVVELKEASERFGVVIESLKPEAERYEREFQEEINAPW